MRPLVGEEGHMNKAMRKLEREAIKYIDEASTDYANSIYKIGKDRKAVAIGAGIATILELPMPAIAKEVAQNITPRVAVYSTDTKGVGYRDLRLGEDYEAALIDKGSPYILFVKREIEPILRENGLTAADIVEKPKEVYKLLRANGYIELGSTLKNGIMYITIICYDDTGRVLSAQSSQGKLQDRENIMESIVREMILETPQFLSKKARKNLNRYHAYLDEYGYIRELFNHKETYQEAREKIDELIDRLDDETFPEKEDLLTGLRKYRNFMGRILENE
jgi:hypothetical protein